MSKTKIGMIGVGGVAQTTHIPNIKRFQKVEISAVADNNEVKAFRVAEKHKIRGVYNDAALMIEKEDLDAVIIMTPTNLHFPVFSMAAAKGMDVFLERPPVLNSNELKKMIDLAEKHDIIVQIGNNLKFDPNLKIFKEIVRTEEIGQLLYANIGWMQSLKARAKSEWMFKKNISGGGVLMDLGIILLELMAWLIEGANVTTVKASVSNFRLAKSVEDFASIFLTLDNGMSIVFEMSWDNVYPEDKFFLKFYGTAGYASYPKLKLFKDLKGHILNFSPQEKQTLKAGLKKSYFLEIEHFINSVINQTRPASSLYDYIPVYEVLEACYRSAKENREVVIAHK